MPRTGLTQRLLMRTFGGPAPLEQHRASFRRFADVGDPLADALVGAMKKTGGTTVRRQFEQALAEGIATVEDPASELRAFFDSVEPVPIWVDQEQLDRASRVTGRLGALALPVFLVGFAATYTVPQANEVLLRTGDTRDKAASRVGETLAWVIQVTSSGGLAVGAPGYQASVRIRLLHAFIRTGMLGRPDWDVALDGYPVNQQTYSSVNVALSLSPLFLGMGLGKWASRRDREAVFHLWRYVGHLAGVHPDLTPTNQRDALRLLGLYHLELSQPDESTHLLGSALIEAYPRIYGIESDTRRDRLRRRLTRSSHSALAHLALGSHTATALGFAPLGPAALLLLAVAMFNLLIGTPAAAIPGVSRVHLAVMRRAQARMAQRVCDRTGADLGFDRSGR